MSTRTVGVDIDGKYGGDFLIFIRRVTVTVTVHSISQVDDGPLPFVAAAESVTYSCIYTDNFATHTHTHCLGGECEVK